MYLLIDHKITVKPISHDHIDANKWYVPFGVKISNEIKIIAKKVTEDKHSESGHESN